MQYPIKLSSELRFHPLMARHVQGRNPEWRRVGVVRPWRRGGLDAVFDLEAAVVAPAWDDREQPLQPGLPVVEFGVLCEGRVIRVASVSVTPQVRAASRRAARTGRHEGNGAGTLASGAPGRKHAILAACQRTCERCGGPSTYSSYEQTDERFGYDAVFCERCDIWLEPGCKDPHCNFCSIRPARPSLVPYPRDDR